MCSYCCTMCTHVYTCVHMCTHVYTMCTPCVHMCTMCYTMYTMCTPCVHRCTPGVHMVNMGTHGVHMCTHVLTMCTHVYQYKHISMVSKIIVEDLRRWWSSSCSNSACPGCSQPLGQFDASENGPKWFPIPENLGLKKQVSSLLRSWVRISLLEVLLYLLQPLHPVLGLQVDLGLLKMVSNDSPIPIPKIWWLKPKSRL